MSFSSEAGATFAFKKKEMVDAELGILIGWSFRTSSPRGGVSKGFDKNCRAASGSTSAGK
jgi:hypothetical protein